MGQGNDLHIFFAIKKLIRINIIEFDKILCHFLLRIGFNGMD